MTQTLTQRLQRAVALRDAATGGDYEFSRPYDSRTSATQFKLTVVGTGRVIASGYGPSNDDLTFLSAAPSIVQLAVELGAECEALRADAERYRWLRDSTRIPQDAVDGHLAVAPLEGDDVLFYAQLDQAIDAAMTKDDTNAN